MATILTWQEKTGAAVLERAVEILAAGGIIACPTETFYALMVDVFQEKALARLMAVKGRSEHKPLLVLVADGLMVGQVAREIPPLAGKFMAAFWPGPLTLILPARPGLPRPLTGGTDTIGVRQSGHPLARQLCAHYGRPLTGTSANISGREALTKATQVQEELGQLIDLIFDNGPCAGGLPSTIVSVVEKRPRLVRAGAIAVAELEQRLGKMLG